MKNAKKLEIPKLLKGRHPIKACQTIAFRESLLLKRKFKKELEIAQLKPV
jgi:hypothetical protein